jgi:hypothetical protein
MKAFIFLLIFSVCRNCFAAEFILKLKPDSDALSLNDFNILTFAYNSAAQLYKVDLSQSQFINLSLNKNVQYLVPNIKIQIKDFSRPETLVAPQKQWNLEKVNAAQAWALAGNKGSRKIVVAVIDSGVDANHPDLDGLASSEVIICSNQKVHQIALCAIETLCATGEPLITNYWRLNQRVVTTHTTIIMSNSQKSRCSANQFNLTRNPGRDLNGRLRRALDLSLGGVSFSETGATGNKGFWSLNSSGI